MHFVYLFVFVKCVFGGFFFVFEECGVYAVFAPVGAAEPSRARHEAAPRPHAAEVEILNHHLLLKPIKHLLNLLIPIQKKHNTTPLSQYSELQENSPKKRKHQSPTKKRQLNKDEIKYQRFIRSLQKHM